MKKYIALALIAVLALSGCTSPTEPDSGKFQIVASTNVWGDIAKTVGGDLVEVTSIIDDANKDPHSYEATARDQLAVEKADLIVANGGGYDDFIEKLSEAAGNKSMFRVSSAVTAVAWQENEHLWYSISAVGEATYALAETLGALDPNNSAAYLTNADQLVEGLTGVAAMYGEVRKLTEGYTYFGTEPLAAWLLADLGFVNKTPAEFSEAIENETDVPPSVMKESLDLIKGGKIKYLVINAQTQNSQVQQIVDAAREAGVRAVMLSEVLPKGTPYVEWMGDNLITLDPSK
ncbi:MAG: zinc ABC transporter substrate-binding protein [Rhodoluna sp.]|nr:zinc ABC transporter substrate-binding protein [Rhodoluna sp.]